MNTRSTYKIVLKIIDVAILQITIGFVTTNSPVLSFVIHFLDPNLTVGDEIVPVKFATGISAFVLLRPVTPLQILTVASKTFTKTSAIDASAPVLLPSRVSTKQSLAKIRLTR